MNAPIWTLEWRVAFRRRRLFGLNVAIPLLLVLPVALAGAPAYHAAAVYAVLFTLFGTFGSTIPFLREGDGGSLRRIVLTGASEPRLVGERVLAGTALDALQLLPAFAAVFVIGGTIGGFAPALASLLLALLAANLVGAWVAATARSLAEGALFAAVVSLFLLHGSGVFRTARPGTPSALLETALPFGPVHRALLWGAGGSGGAGPAPGFTIPVLTTLGLFALTVIAAPRLVDRITAPR